MRPLFILFIFISSYAFSSSSISLFHSDNIQSLISHMEDASEASGAFVVKEHGFPNVTGPVVWRCRWLPVDLVASQFANYARQLLEKNSYELIDRSMQDFKFIMGPNPLKECFSVEHLKYDEVRHIVYERMPDGYLVSFTIVLEN